MFTKRNSSLLAIAVAGVLFGAPMWAQTTTPSATKLAAQYTELAGSRQNAEILITGLRDGKAIVLTSSSGDPSQTPTKAAFMPATGKLGYGEVNIALSLAKASLAKQGITNPTPAQLEAALNGGTITTANGTVTLAGVLTQRQAGQGWGVIAQSLGVKLGAVVSASKTDKAGKKEDKSAQSKSDKPPVSKDKSAQESDEDVNRSKSNNGNQGSGNSKNNSGGNSGNSGGGNSGGNSGGSSGGGGGKSK